MSILAALTGVGALASPISAIGNILDKMFTSDEEKLDKQILMQRVLQQPDLIKAEINKVEASHRSIFVAGWRPFIGWVCGGALAYNFVFRDMFAWVVTNWGDGTITMPPALQMEHLLTILMALLGLGSLRTFEKFQGKAK